MTVGSVSDTICELDSFFVDVPLISVILPRLSAIAKANNENTNETRRRDIATELLEGFKALSCCCILFQSCGNCLV